MWEIRDGNEQKVIETHEAGERENMTKGNGEWAGNNRESLGKHREQDGSGSGKLAEGAKVKRFVRLHDWGGCSRQFMPSADGSGELKAC